MYDYFFEQEPIPIKLDFKAQTLQRLLNNNGKCSLFSIRKLTSEYNKIYNEKISKSKIYNILRYDLNYHYV